MARLTLLYILPILAALALVSNAAPAATTQANDSANLSVIGDVLAPEQERFDYSVFLNDLTPAQRQQVNDVIAQTAGKSDDEKRAIIQAAADPASFSPSLKAAATGSSRKTFAASTSDAETQSILDTSVYASIAYCTDTSSLASWSCGTKCASDRVRGTQPIIALNGQSTFGYIALRPSAKQIIVSYRGTTVQVKNFIDDLDFIRFPYPYSTQGLSVSGLSVHKGFTIALDETRSQLRSALAPLAAAHPDYDVVFTGHSLGGSMAALAAVDQVGSGALPASRIKLITFHAPRTGDSDWARLVNTIGFKTLLRVTQENDIVPHLPPAAFPFSFEHEGNERWAHKGSFHACAGDEDWACSNSRVPFLDPLQHLNFFDMEWYFGKLGPLGCHVTL
ncbi:Alpha/Beta hydrolase protein [Blastocladiella britannica]|nr:Alpha/Beta hydrolase protein [Blastocladiella britannica]